MTYLIVNDLNGKILKHCKTEESAYSYAVDMGCSGLQVSIKMVSKD